MAEKGLLLVLNPAWFGYGGADWRQYLTNANARGYGQFLSNRYKGYSNVTWFLGGDDDPGNKSTAIVILAAGLRDNAPNQLISDHAAPGGSSSNFYHTATWLGYNMVYTYGDGYTQMLSDCNRTSLTKPALLAESSYEGAGADNLRLCKQAYWVLLSGGTGHAYGHGAIWKFDSGWPNAMNSVGLYTDSADAHD